MAYQKLQASKAAPVTPSDTVNIPNPSVPDESPNEGNVLYVGFGGDLKVTTVSGDDITFYNIQDSTFFPVQVVRVWATGTTAQDIIALW
jgi:hypothetical protein